MFKNITYYKLFVNDLEKKIIGNNITDIKDYQLAVRNFMSRGYYKIYLQCRDKFYNQIEIQRLATSKSSHTEVINKLKSKGQYDAYDKLSQLSILRKFADYDHLNTTIVDLNHEKTLKLINDIELEIEWEDKNKSYKAINIKLFAQYMDDILLALSKI